MQGLMIVVCLASPTLNMNLRTPSLWHTTAESEIKIVLLLFLGWLSLENKMPTKSASMMMITSLSTESTKTE